METKALELSKILKVIANPNRLQILCLLQNQASSVSKLHENIPNISMAALSQHLTALKLAGLIDAKKQGLNVIYHLADEKIIKVINVLKETYCAEDTK
ncbi:MAG: metalloregulator ArsR/SmtB family transcription factor [Erysipelotrichaceae bacterium]|nr:metalloregulator ArsR/SmtB family transcription factor [Erysipelotrichaceae bacterium]MDY5252179.1 metalloregulator ArsR/SmtB family transcription factor [Erysipelotrichaceae bacterium]